MKRKKIKNRKVLVPLLIFLLAVLIIVAKRTSTQEPKVIITPDLKVISPIPSSNPIPSKPNQINNILLDIPFTSQAPLGNWSDPREQDGCEEASSLMVIFWIRNQKLNPQLALDQILAISAYEEKIYGSYHDTSAKDTIQRIIKGYFNYDKVYAKENIALDDLLEEISASHAIIVPLNGQAIKNPYYTQPGPERHMLVIRGYDNTTGEFITNDPGTKRGEQYRYPKEVLYNAIRDFPTGDHVPIAGIKKSMIVVIKD